VKRLLDLLVSLTGLAVGSVILVPATIAVWLQDWRSPFYVATRAGRGGTPFRMVKLRSMRVLADQAGGSSTAGDDPRITAIGRFVRRWKLDELTQLWNVLLGDMSLVGPRPQVLLDTTYYTDEERELLGVRPGITDLASIVFADEGEILRGAADPDLLYNQVVRPWKSRLALLYVRQRPSVILDLRIILLTLRTIASREAALLAASDLVKNLGGGEKLAQVAIRRWELEPAPPPGASEIVQVVPGR
jgi:lipopolysaccharide/colanic/teichoic acid biosynthesis glycosyltransferase